MKIRGRLSTNQQLTGGFTLIEIMVAVSIFAIVMTVGVGSLLTINDAHRRSRAQRGAVDSISFMLDSMAREMYTGYGFSCEGSTDCYTANGGDRIVFTNQDGCGVEIELDDGDIRRRLSDCGSTDWEYLSSNEYVTIDSLIFRLRGAKNDDNDPLQPMVVITVNGSVGSGNQVQNLSMQTTVSQRLLDAAEGE